MRCAYCGKVFTQRRKDQRYCSKSCRNMASRRRTRRRSKTSKNANNLPGLTKICVNEKAHTSTPAKRKLAFCPTCGKEFYARREGQKYCSRSCSGKAKIAKAQKARREALAEAKRNLLGIEIPAVWRFTIHNCDYCANHMRDGCPSPRANILAMPIKELPPEFWEIIKSRSCPGAEFRVWDDSCRHYDGGACARRIKSCDGCAHNFRTVKEVMG